MLIGVVIQTQYEYLRTIIINKSALFEHFKLNRAISMTMDGEHRFTSARRTLIGNSLQQVVYSIQHVLTPEIVKTGYKRIGQYTVSFMTTMSRCTRPISAVDMDIMQQKLPAMVDIFRSKGVLTESDMDSQNILSVNEEANNARPKDDRPLHQQRSVIMNSLDCIAQYRSYVNNRDAEPARRALAVQQRDAARIVKEAKAREVSARKALKDAEKVRRTNLTLAERKEEDKQKRAAVKAAKQAAIVQNVPDVVQQGDIESDDDVDNLFDEHEIDDISSNTRAILV
jgi:hypothetical protein